MTDRSIAGEWVGRYIYDKLPTHGGGFTAFISENSGAIHGTIVDDGKAGKATLNGTFSFPEVHFCKMYVKPSKNESEKREKIVTPKFQIGIGKFGFGIGHEQTRITKTTETFGNPVEYHGTMSQDGQHMSGTWKIQSEKNSASGTWSASRQKQDDVQEKIKTNVTEDVSV